MECNCNLHHRLAGDGCEACNPALALELARETIEDQRAEIERLRDNLQRMRKRAGCATYDNGRCPTVGQMLDALKDIEQGCAKE